MSNTCKTHLIDIPTEIPVFPLESVLLLPRGDLPLNVFEPRYLAMVDAALRGSRLIGIIQPYVRNAHGSSDLYPTGCIGRITRFEEADGGRYLINLHGVCRFKNIGELPQADGGYRVMRVDWQSYVHDMNPVGCLDIDRVRLVALLRNYFDRQGMCLDWDLIDAVADESLLTTLAMVCPFTSSEKQALLEAPCCKSRAALFISLLEISLCESKDNNPSTH